MERQRRRLVLRASVAAGLTVPGIDKEGSRRPILVWHTFDMPFTLPICPALRSPGALNTMVLPRKRVSSIVHGIRHESSPVVALPGAGTRPVRRLFRG